MIWKIWKDLEDFSAKPTQISKRNHLIFQFQFNNENNKHY